MVYDLETSTVLGRVKPKPKSGIDVVCGLVDSTSRQNRGSGSPSPKISVQPLHVMVLATSFSAKGSG
jgi:hypothetical protein